MPVQKSHHAASSSTDHPGLPVEGWTRLPCGAGNDEADAYAVATAFVDHCRDNVFTEIPSTVIIPAISSRPDDYINVYGETSCGILRRAFNACCNRGPMRVIKLQIRRGRSSPIVQVFLMPAIGSINREPIRRLRCRLRCQPWVAT